MIAGGAFIGYTRAFAICFREVHWHSEVKP
jgi:hypothetical protein